MSFVFIVNPGARRVDDEVSVESLEEMLGTLAPGLVVRRTEKAGDAMRFARQAVQDGCRRVMVGGGDGTVNEVIQGLAQSSTAMAVIPLGTGNVLARNIGLDEEDLEAACRIAVEGTVRQIDLGRMDDRFFAAMAGVGLDAEVARNLDPWWKKQVGKIAFLGEFMKRIIIEEPREYKIRLDDREIKGQLWGILIANTTEYTWRVQPSAHARPDDGLLDAVFIHRVGFIELMDLAARMFFSGETAEGHPTASVMRVRKMTIHTASPVAWQTDGEVLGKTPVRVAVVPGALRLVTPENKRD